MVDVVLEPQLDDPLQQPRQWHVPDAMMDAERQLEALLPGLRATHNDGKWIAVNAEGRFRIEESQDKAEIAMITKIGSRAQEFVVRMID